LAATDVPKRQSASKFCEAIVDFASGVWSALQLDVENVSFCFPDVFYRMRFRISPDALAGFCFEFRRLAIWRSKFDGRVAELEPALF
jgi:hypothetical protein